MDATKLRQIFETLDGALESDDVADVTFLIKRFRLTKVDITESFERLPARFKTDPVVQDNFRYIVEDLL